LTISNGCPALRLDEGQLIAFSTLKPSSLQTNVELILRLYCENISDPREIEWWFECRWGTNFEEIRNTSDNVPRYFPALPAPPARFSVYEGNLGSFSPKENSLVINLKHDATEKSLLLMVELWWKI
jgi:hypothetical protein